MPCLSWNFARGKFCRARSVFDSVLFALRAWVAVCMLPGCIAYQAAPLRLTIPLQSAISAMNHDLPGGGFITSRMPLPVSDVVALAMVNDPDLMAARTQHDIAQADVLNAGLLPDPVISGNFAALLSGPADAPAIAGGLMEDISPLITYAADRRAARAGLRQVDTGLLWQEWQVAAQTRQLCATIAGEKQSRETLQQDQTALAAVNRTTAGAVGAGNLTIAEASAAQTALATTVAALDAATQTLDQDRDQLDALLGLQSGIDIPIARAPVPRVDPGLARAAIATLADRRPDLIALRYGYQQADARLRAAILSQFLPISIGPAAGRDTSKVVSAGPAITLTLPLFNRNRAAIAISVATRAQLAAQFRASLASAAGDAESLLARITLLEDQSASADQASTEAASAAAQARLAFQNGDLDAVSEVNFETAATEREREAIALRVQLDTANISLATILGFGLPPIATNDLEPAA